MLCPVIIARLNRRTFAYIKLGLDYHAKCSHFVLMTNVESGDGQLYTLGLLEQLRAECGALWGTSSRLYFRVDELLRELANPNLHDIANMNFRVELWDRHAEHVRWVVAATGTVSIAHAAFDAAIANWPTERFALRQGIMLIREHGSKGRKDESA
jgi:hypothetical protein